MFKQNNIKSSQILYEYKIKEFVKKYCRMGILRCQILVLLPKSKRDKKNIKEIKRLN